MPDKDLKVNLDKNFSELSGSLEALFFQPLAASFSVLEKAMVFLSPENRKDTSREGLIKSLTGLEEILQSYTGSSFLTQEPFQVAEPIKSYNTELEKILSKEEKTIRVVQSEERFTPHAGDPLMIKAGKFIKYIYYGTRQAGWRMFGKRRNRQAFRFYQIIPHWQILRYVYRNRLQEKLLPVLEELLPGSCSLHAELRQLAERIEKIFLFKLLDMDDGVGGDGDDSASAGKDIHPESERISLEIKALNKEMDRQLAELNGILANEYERLMAVCGTIEFPGSRLWPGRINSRYRSILARINETFTAWGRNHWLLYEDWRFDRKILSLVLDKYEDHIKVSGVYSKRVKEGIDRFFEENKKIGEEFIVGLETGQVNRIQLESNYRNLKYRSSGILIRQVSHIQRAGLSREITRIAQNLSERAGKKEESRTFARSFQPGKLVRNRDIVEVKPMQLVSVDIAPRLASRLDAISMEVNDQIEKITGLMMQYSGIIDFGIASVFSGRTRDQKDDPELKQTILEGFSRAAGKVPEADEIMNNLERLIYQDISEVLASEAERLLELQDNESVLALALKLARVKTVRTLRNYGQNLGSNLKMIGMAPVRGPVMIYRKSSELTRKLRKKIGYTSKPVKISTELSDFLSKTDSVFNSLPYVYQRLYYIEPLEDELFFVERKQVLDQINLAMKNWLEDGYSPLVLVGEKGSGATTTLTVFQNRTKDYPFYRIRNRSQIYDLETFVKHMSMETGLKQNTDFEVLKEHLRNLPEPSIIILEDLQRYYLRAVNGFSVLKKIFELISSTNLNILWLTSCTLYAWNYLDRVLSISSYFGFTVRLDDMDDRGILDVIEQRHRISGFDVRYVPNKLQENNRKIMRMQEDERQEFLAESYRSSLARFARGNISLALVHWIRSTSEIQDKTVVISSIYEPESAFFDSLNADRILSIYMILIHDGLSERLLSEILKKSNEEMRIILFQLFDDGILVRNNDNYLLNPLIYRPAVNFLTLKNYLH